MEVRSVEAIVRALNEARVQYLIVGGLAVNAHGYERLTKDVDLVIGLEPDNITRGLHALIDIGYALSIPVTPEEFAEAERREEWRREKGMVVLKLWSDLHRRTPIDVFIYEPFNFSSEYAAAKWEPVLGSVLAPVVQYQILLKMKREAGRPQDLADIADLEEIEKLRQDRARD
ncbi:MAG: hypothetical protein ABI217_11880 [Chthoniobacterales bacterium]